MGCHSLTLAGLQLSRETRLALNLNFPSVSVLLPRSRYAEPCQSLDSGISQEDS